MYGWPTFPGQELVTDRALRAFRNNTLKLPAALRMSPYQRQQQNLVASK